MSKESTIHAYRRLKSGEVRRIKSVDTFSKLRKHPDAVHSVTAVTSSIPSFFMDEIWKPEAIARIARENPDYDRHKIKETMWGYREGPDGEVTSSEFGTNAHASMENHLIHLREGSDYKDWYSPLCSRFIKWFTDNDLEVVETEKQLIENTCGVGMTVDLIARTDQKRIVILDFKFRRCRGRVSSCTYPKDLIQLAQNSVATMHELNLKYLPKVASVVVDSDDGMTHVKWWSQRKQLEAIEVFKHANAIFKWNNNLK